MQATIGGESITINKCTKLAIAIWQSLQKLPAEKVRKQNIAFCTTHPLVFRYMEEMHMFDAAIFKKYLVQIKNNPWKTEDAYLDSQAFYAAYLVAKQARMSYNSRRKLMQQIKKDLVDEHERFKQIANDAKLAVDNKCKEFDAQNRDELRKLDINLNFHLRVISDDSLVIGSAAKPRIGAEQIGWSAADSLLA